VIAVLDGRLAPRDDHLLVAHEGPDQRAARQAQRLDLLALAVAQAHLELEHLGAPLADHRHRSHRARAHEAQDALGAQDARRDGPVDAE
jgi:hypothetical protein